MAAVNHPMHYGGADNPYEAIKVIEAWEAGFHIGNVLKYLCRAGLKGIDTVEDIKQMNATFDRELEDLEKAAWYLNRKINMIKKDQATRIEGV